MKQGQMLLYEPATLIHGRPTPFESNIYANSFLHYRPTPVWKWRRENQAITDGEISEKRTVLNTPLTTPSQSSDTNSFAEKKDEL